MLCAYKIEPEAKQSSSYVNALSVEVPLSKSQ